MVGMDVVGNLDGVGARRLEHGNGDRRLAVEQRAQRIVGSAQFDAGDIAQAGDLAIVAGLDDDVAEFFRRAAAGPGH